MALSEQRNTRPSMNSLAAPPRLIQNPDSIDNPTLDFFIRCWNEKRGDRAMPARAAFEMREIKDYVGWICLLDALPDFRDFRYRLVGSRVADYFLGDGTGKTIRELFSGDDKPLGQALLWVYQKTCRERLPLRGRGRKRRARTFSFGVDDSARGRVRPNKSSQRRIVPQGLKAGFV